MVYQSCPLDSLWNANQEVPVEREGAADSGERMTPEGGQRVPILLLLRMYVWQRLCALPHALDVSLP